MIECPAQLTEAEKKECEALIVEGGAVSSDYVNRWFLRSIEVAVKRSGPDIVGVGVIKPFRPCYTANVARRSGSDLISETHELGYVTVKKAHRRRGISRAIIQALLSAHEGPLFATTSNAAIKCTLKRFGFVQRDNEWPGSRDSVLSLWVRE